MPTSGSTDRLGSVGFDEGTSHRQRRHSTAKNSLGVSPSQSTFNFTALGDLDTDKMVRDGGIEVAPGESTEAVRYGSGPSVDVIRAAENADVALSAQDREDAEIRARAKDVQVAAEALDARRTEQGENGEERWFGRDLGPPWSAANEKKTIGVQIADEEKSAERAGSGETMGGFSISETVAMAGVSECGEKPGVVGNAEVVEDDEGLHEVGEVDKACSFDITENQRLTNGQIYSTTKDLDLLESPRPKSSKETIRTITVDTSSEITAAELYQMDEEENPREQIFVGS